MLTTEVTIIFFTCKKVETAFSILVNMAHYFGLKLIKLFFSIFLNDILSILIFIFDSLLFVINFFRFSVILFSNFVFQITLCLLLFFLKFFPLFSNSITNRFFNITLAFSNILLVYPLGLFFGIFQLVITPSSSCSLALPITI